MIYVSPNTIGTVGNYQVQNNLKIMMQYLKE